MRHSRVWAIFAVITAFFVVGCGGGGSSSSTSVAGFWTGSFTEKGVSSTPSTLQATFTQNGTTITGTVVLSGNSTGALSGTIQGNQFNATITTPTLRTDKQFGFGAPNSYYTTAPMDLSRPIVVIVGSVVLQGSPSPTPQYTVDTSVSTLYSNRIYIPTVVPTTTFVQIQYYPYASNPGVGTTTNFTGTAFGNSITGGYTTSTTSGPQTGTFVLTKPIVDPAEGSAIDAIGRGSVGK
jgi:hypothetical protein